MPAASHIVTYTDPGELWQEVFPAWFEAHAKLRPPGSPPVVVLAPDVTRLGWLKKTWLERGGGPLLGVQFWTPGHLRRHLLKLLLPGSRLATAEDLALLLRLVLKDEPADTPLGVVAQNPNSFLYAWDTWLAARAQPSLFVQAWRTVPPRLEKALEALGLQSVRAIDAQLASLDRASTPPLGPLLMDGFSALQATHFPLLSSALDQAETSLCTFPFPRERRVELVWNSTVEALLGCDSEMAAPDLSSQRPFKAWAERAEAGRAVEDKPEGLAFRLFRTRSDEIAALAHRVETLHTQSDGGPLAVALPPEPYLVRGLVARLLERGLPVHDSFGYYPTGADTEQLFAAWVAYQKTNQLIEADAFLETLVNSGDLSAQDANRIRRAWRYARERTLSDALSVLTAYLQLEGDGVPGQPNAVEWAGLWPRLPESATMALFLEISAPAFSQWDDAPNFEEIRKGWSQTWEHYPEPIDRSCFLEWLWQSLRRPGKARALAARDAFAPIQIIAYEMLGSGSWSSLLLAGLNEGLVPAPQRETAFLQPDAAHRHLSGNLIQGPQGEGHELLRPGAGFLLSDTDQRALLGGALYDAIGATSLRVELFATYAPEGKDRSATVLSAFYQRLFRAAMGPDAPYPNPETQPDEMVRTRRTVDNLPLQKTAYAFARRFDPQTPFDAYSFSYDKAPAETLVLGARQWEALLKRPATVWLESIARLRPEDDLSEPVALPLLRGSAVHRILCLPRKTAWHALKLKGGDAWLESVRKQSDHWRRQVEEACKLMGTELSPLWHEQWGTVQQNALALARIVVAGAGETHLATEYPLPEGARWTSPEGHSLAMRGRIDALLVDDPARPTKVIVIDFKTGGDSALSAKKLETGDGLQLLLYGGALADLWQTEISLTIVKPEDTDLVTQLLLKMGEDPSGTLAGLSSIAQSGRIGFAGQVRSEYNYVGDYPIAFIAPPADIVVEKWRHTHPGLSIPKGTEA